MAPPRTTTLRRDRERERERDNDFSAVGKIGRRTGVTLPQGRLDENGIEEITAFFSSPRKPPSPLRRRNGNVTALDVLGNDNNSACEASAEMVGMDSPGPTPSHVLSTRKSLRRTSLPPPRSASPRKTGISGSARRSHGVDVLSPAKGLTVVDPEDRENIPVVTPTQPVKQIIRKFNPSPTKAKTPLSEVNGNGVMVPTSLTDKQIAQEPSGELWPRGETTGVSDMDVYEKTIDEIEEAINASIQDESGFVPNGLGDDEHVIDGTRPEEADDIQLPQQSDDDAEGVDASFEPLPEEAEDAAVGVAAPPPTKANQRKRKSESFDRGGSSADHGAASPRPGKKVRTAATKVHKEKASKGRKPDVHQDATSVRGVPLPNPAKRKPIPQPGKVKDPNIHLSARQETELNEIIEKVATRPGKQKSLYILKRETPADESATHTRSGRVSVKPLAYWRNERCVYGGSPGGSHVQDGARFPLNSIKEIIRTEHVGPESDNQHSRKSGRNKKKANKAHRSLHDEDGLSDSSDDGMDPNAEPWETEIGIFQGPVLMWDRDLQAPVDVEEEMDIAYAPAAIITREVKGSTFRYAKLLSNGFFGSGIVELPPGGVKRPKNSRKMHMSFFVAAGRVTAQVGGVFGDEEQPGSRFSVGKGGFWQVPRGNQYSIANELDKPAKIFFSQGCEPAPEAEEE